MAPDNLRGGYLFTIYFFKEIIAIYLSFKHFISIWTSIFFIYIEAKRLGIDVNNSSLYIKKCLRDKYITIISLKK